MLARYLVILILILIGINKKGLAQKDSLLFNDGDKILGDVESMEKGVLKFSTEYSDSDFKIEWKEINKIYTSNQFYIALKKGKPLYGTINSISDSLVQINTTDSLAQIFNTNEIVQILPLKDGFKDRFEAEIDIGFGSAKSNNLRQLSVGFMMGYKAKKWRSFVNYTTNRSTQDEVDPIKRSDADLVYEHVIYKNWYLVPSLKYLASSEQELNYRINTQVGFGNYIIRSNYAFWGLKVGINRNREDYDNDNEDSNSWEGYFGTEADLFDIGDLNFYTSILAYRGITEKGRWRLDGSIKIKYDLPLDFYIKLEFSTNYDNMPKNEGSDFDYVSLLGFGWEW